MDHKTTFSSAAAALAASLVIVMSTSAQGACKTTLRGELLQAPGGSQAFPLQFLFFSLSETTQDSGTSAEKRLKPFQSFIVPNTSATLPIPFALDIDQPKDCPSELELSVSTDRTDRSDPTPRFNNDHVARFRFGGADVPLTGRKTIHLDKFESIPVRGPRF